MTTALQLEEWRDDTVLSWSRVSDPFASYLPSRRGLTLMENPEADVLEKSLSDVVYIALPATAQLSFNYQTRGSDSLSIGDARCWIEGKARRALVEGYWSAEFVESHAMQYLDLLDSVVAQCAHGSWVRPGLEQIYSIRDARAVDGFLQRHPELIPVLLDASPYLERFFGAGPRVILEVIRDPEVEEADELVASILTALPVNEAMVRLDKIDEEWFLGHVDKVGGIFNLNLVFV